MNITEFKKNVKDPFYVNYKKKVESEGYNIAVGIGFGKNSHTLEVRLQPLAGSPDPIPKNLFDRIKNEILPNQYMGAVVNVVYIGIVRPR